MNYDEALEIIKQRKRETGFTNQQIAKNVYVCDATVRDWSSKRQVMNGLYFTDVLILLGCRLTLNYIGEEIQINTYEEAVAEIRERLKLEKIPRYKFGREMKVAPNTVGRWLNKDQAMGTDKLLRALELLGYETEIKTEEDLEQTIEERKDAEMRPKVIIDGFPERLEQAIVDSKLNYAEICRRTKITRSNLWAWRQGTKYPTFEQLVMICKALEVSSDWLLGIDKKG